jgi:hypothetical protein
LFLFALGAHALHARRRSLQSATWSGIRHPHDRVGHPIGFTLVLVVGRADGELRLDDTRLQQAEQSLIANLALQPGDRRPRDAGLPWPQRP